MRKLRLLLEFSKTPPIGARLLALIKRLNLLASWLALSRAAPTALWGRLGRAYPGARSQLVLACPVRALALLELPAWVASGSAACRAQAVSLVVLAASFLDRRPEREPTALLAVSDRRMTLLDRVIPS